MMIYKRGCMKELTEEIKHTIDMMNSDIDDGAHSELQSHLYSLLEMKRELLKTQIDQQQNKMLTIEDLKRGDWWCADIGAGCAKAFRNKGFVVSGWNVWGCGTHFDCCTMSVFSNVTRYYTESLDDNLRQIKRIGGEFYYC